jgi:type IV secretory pathway TrbL component
LNSGIVLTIILPFTERETIEITNSLISLKQKAELSKLRIDIAKKKLACSIRASRKVLFLERALALVSRVLFLLVLQVLELLVSRALVLLVSRALFLLVLQALGPLFPP